MNPKNFGLYPRRVCLAYVLLVTALFVAGCRPSPPELAESGQTRDLSGFPDTMDELADQTIEPPRVSVRAPDGSASPPTAPDGTADPLAETMLTKPTESAQPARVAEPNPAADPEDTAPPDWKDWEKPAVAFVLSGQQYGYIEPCGCTGLENQKGGMARRATLIDQVRQQGWTVVPLDGGNQVRRFGRQAEVKFQTTISGLQKMGYQAIGFGPGDLRLGVGELLSVAAHDGDEPPLFVSANVTLLDPDLMPTFKRIQEGGKQIFVTTMLDPDNAGIDSGDEITIAPLAAALTSIKSEITEADDFKILLFCGDEDAATAAVAKHAPDTFDLLLVSGGYGEPTYKPQTIQGSKTQMIITGNKGMYSGLVGLYQDGQFQYARVALTHDFTDSSDIMQLMASYQNQLQAVGLEGLGLRPVAHPKGTEFVGSKACGECHTTAYEIWEGTPHYHATESLVHPPNERGDVPRHFDPECLSCHVTGWNPQNYYPYVSGYLDLQESAHLHGNGCENCHGPGSEHVAAERDKTSRTEAQLAALRESMRLPLSKAKETCMECHDLDNSPDFHVGDAFEDLYWPQIEHYGMD